MQKNTPTHTHILNCRTQSITQVIVVFDQFKLMLCGVSWHLSYSFIDKLNPFINFGIYKVTFSNHSVCWKHLDHFLWSTLWFCVRLHFLGLGPQTKCHHPRPRKWSLPFVHSFIQLFPRLLPSVLRSGRPHCGRSSDRFGHSSFL